MILPSSRKFHNPPVIEGAGERGHSLRFHCIQLGIEALGEQVRRLKPLEFKEVFRGCGPVRHENRADRPSYPSIRPVSVHEVRPAY